MKILLSGFVLNIEEKKGCYINMHPKPLITKFGRVAVDTSGYYRVTSRKEGNHHKLLHRLIFEDFYGEIPEGCVIHHKDGSRFNNCILNLALMSRTQHQTYHNTGYRNVSINKRSCYKQGFTYRYRYYENGKPKAITSVNIDDLKAKVIAKGLIWEKFDEGVEMNG